jgi:hypothetical protein
LINQEERNAYQFFGWLILCLIIDTLLHGIPFTAALIARYWPPM